MEFDTDSIPELIKNEIKQSQSIMKIFKRFKIHPDRLDTLKIVICDLEKKYAETDMNEMRIDNSLFKNGWQSFIENGFFVVAHEIIHWLTRTKENMSYFSDPEEIDGFIMSIAYEIEQGSDMDTIWNRIFPKIEFHFNGKKQARQFFEGLIEDAVKIVKNP